MKNKTVFQHRSRQVHTADSPINPPPSWVTQVPCRSNATPPPDWLTWGTEANDNTYQNHITLTAAQQQWSGCLLSGVFTWSKKRQALCCCFMFILSHLRCKWDNKPSPCFSSSCSAQAHFATDTSHWQLCVVYKLSVFFTAYYVADELKSNTNMCCPQYV